MARCTCGLHEPVLRACAGCAVAAVLPVEKGEGTTLVFHTILLSRLRPLTRSSGSPHYVMFFRRLFAVTRKSCMVGSPGCSTNAALPANAQTEQTKTHPAYQRTIQAHGARRRSAAHSLHIVDGLRNRTQCHLCFRSPEERLRVGVLTQFQCHSRGRHNILTSREARPVVSTCSPGTELPAAAHTSNFPSCNCAAAKLLNNFTFRGSYEMPRRYACSAAAALFARQ